MAQERQGASRSIAFPRLSLPLWLTIAFIAALLALAALMVWQNYRSAVAAAEVRAVSSAHVVAAHVQWMIEASDQAIRRIDSALGDHPVASSANVVSNITQAVGDLPAGFRYAVYDENGQLRLSSSANPANTNVASQPYFGRLKNEAEQSISRLFVDPVLGEPVFVIARRITRGGEFRGVASITIPTSKMDEFWSSMGLGPHSTVSLVRTDGWLIARHPGLKESVNLKNVPLFNLYPEKQTGFYHSAVSPVDGYARIIGFWKVDGWPLIALTAIERQEALAPFWTSLRAELIFGLPLLAMLVAASIYIVRLLHRYSARNRDLEHALERNQMLFREIHHRVKNNLQAVLALVRLQPLPADARDDMARRIGAMIAVHEQIYQSDQFERVEVAPYAERLIREVAGSYHSPVAIDLDIEPLTVDREQALPLGMIINEVVSNAFKYAFAAGDSGILTVSLKKQDQNLALTIRDNGPGMPERGSEAGMGSKLINAFTKQLRGESGFQNDRGTVFSLTMPLDVGG